MRIVTGIVMPIVMLLGMLSSTVEAQPAPPPGKPADARERIKQRVRALRAYTLTERLALDEATAAKLFPALAKYDEEFDKLLAARVALQRRLENVDAIKDPKAVDRLIDEAVANQRALWDAEEKRLLQLRKILTPAQVARVIVVLPQMERKIQNQLRRAVQRGKIAPSDLTTVDPFDPDGVAPPPQRRGPP